MIATRTYKRFPWRLQEAVDAARLDSAQICLTRQCNERCRHCLVTRGDVRLQSSVAERLIPELTELGCRIVHFTGGEPLLHPHWQRLCSAVLDAGMHLKLITNATLLSEQAARFLGRIRPDDVQVSLYGADAPVHDFTTRSPGSFAATMRGMRRLREQGVSVTVAILAMRHNFHQLSWLERKLTGEGFRVVVDCTVRPTDAGSREPLRYRLSNPQLRSAFRMGMLGISAKEKRLPRLRPEQMRYRFLGRRHLFIDADGQVMPAITCRLVLGSVHEHALAWIWRSSPVIRWLRQLCLSDFECSRCPRVYNCLWDPGLALAEHGNLFVAPREYCRFMHSRKGGYSGKNRESPA